MSAYIGPPISTAPRVASSFAGRGAASAASIGLSETDVRQQGEAEFDEYKKRSESTRSVKRNHCGATNRQRIQNALEYVTFAIPDTTEVVKEKRFEIDF